MENWNFVTPEAQDLVGLGIFTLASAAIAINRAVIRRAVNSPKYDQISLQVEHVLHHATLPLAVTPIARAILHNQSQAAAMGFYVSAIKGLFRDVIFTRPGMNFTVLPLKPQLDQFTSDVAGCLLYAGYASLV